MPRTNAPGLLLVMLAAVPACGVPAIATAPAPAPGGFQVQQAHRWAIRDPSGRTIGQGYSYQSSGPGGQSSLMWSGTGGSPAGFMQSTQSGQSGLVRGFGNFGQGAQTIRQQVMGPGGIQQLIGPGGIQQNAGTVQSGLVGGQGTINQGALTNQSGFLDGWGTITQGNVTNQLGQIYGSGGGITQGNVTNQQADVWGGGNVNQSNATSQTVISNTW
jgi:hypothetical protein